MAAVADHQTAPGPIRLGGQLGYVLVDFGLQRGGGHPQGALADDLVDQGTSLGGAVGSDYAEHGRAFPTRAANAGLYSVTCRSFGKVRPSRTPREPIHKY
ncbi:hypothetical protein G3I56_40525 [Streptomyces sp. SID12488]|nr:hypothetical protein [Streptomyces sp. SID12488]